MPRLVGGALRLASCALLFSLVPSAPTAAQELGVMMVRASSPNPELPDPQGIGLFAQFEARSGFGFRMMYVRTSNDTDKPGIVCQVYSPRIDCDTEGVATSAGVGSFRAEATRVLPLGDRLRVDVSAGATFNSLDVTATGVSGRPADTAVPSSGNLGALGTVGLAITPLPALPLTLRAMGSLHWIKFNGCESQDDPTSGYDPFCGTDRFREIQIGLTYRVPRR
ncbi:hypothetical protein WI372_00135 [Gemmatimonadota bacterium DH-20]|uniref:Uncharacterized protein n=2 Tax=Gaopeijia maritima TaxID=3119007 RepID=A0ABU9E3S3_9BACT